MQGLKEETTEINTLIISVSQVSPRPAPCSMRNRTGALGEGMPVQLPKAPLTSGIGDHTHQCTPYAHSAGSCPQAQRQG